ncbi:hypothetical protein D2Q93_12630 [Alicyclobacillaceae bacterium I2511]|nr:hypothetical protein D2Q93_12630 [Alicyclobacillaceae bacterium I2511]
MVDPFEGACSFLTMRTYYGDFHIHVGGSHGHPVKITASRDLTVEKILSYSRLRKGLDVITLIDGVCTGVREEIEHLLQAGTLTPLSKGGYRHGNGLVVFLGAEVEVNGPQRGAAHFGCWFGSLAAAADFAKWLATVQKNVSLSSQKAHTNAQTLQKETHTRGGLFIVHHAFTPHKGLYGNCVSKLGEMVDYDGVDGLELGLSADTEMADRVRELQNITFLSNSDAHSLPKIGREYNALTLEQINFEEVRLALHRQNGRGVIRNFGLHPFLGKYYRTYCLDCGQLWELGANHCLCGSQHKVTGVFDRLATIQDDSKAIHPPHRPPYVWQIPLEFIPGVGEKTIQKLLRVFGNEMNILQRATLEQLNQIVGDKLGPQIFQACHGKVEFVPGGGGIYGRILFPS